MSRMKNGVFTYGCALGSDFPKVTGTVWTGGLVNVTASSLGK